MIDPIGKILGPAPVDMLSITGPKADKTDAITSFGDVFEQAISRVDQAKQESHDKVDRFLNGEDQEVHDMVLSTQRAEISFELFLQVRNKVVQAYQEVMRMQM